LLLVKSRRTYRKPVVLAAVDPFHSHARPAGLDARLINTGATIAKSLRGSLHVFHAYMPLSSVEMAPGGPLMILPPEAEEAHEALVIREVTALAAAAGVPANACHVRLGGVAEELDRASRRARADLVVMGAVSRSALARLFIGNAAERVLDRLRCDILVVKPRGFKSELPKLRAVAVTGSKASGRAASRRPKPRQVRR
jgi:universal stress protein E